MRKREHKPEATASPRAQNCRSDYRSFSIRYPEVVLGLLRMLQRRHRLVASHPSTPWVISSATLLPKYIAEMLKRLGQRPCRLGEPEHERMDFGNERLRFPICWPLYPDSRCCMSEIHPARSLLNKSEGRAGRKSDTALAICGRATTMYHMGPNRSFGLILAAGCAVLGVFAYRGGRGSDVVWGLLAAVFLLTAVAVPRVLAPARRGWVKLGGWL